MPKKRLLWLALAISGGCAILLLSTSPMLPMVWDEGDAIVRAGGVGRWLGLLSTNDAENATPAASPWSAAAIAQHWHYTTQREGHPALFGILIALGQRIAPAWLDPLTAARLGPILLFSLALGMLFYRLAVDYTWSVGAVAVAALIGMPRLLAHAHFASFDGPLTSCWLICWSLFAPARQSWRSSLPWGAALGCTLSAKFTGSLAVLPFIAWVLLYRDRAGLRTLLVGLPVALATFVALNPPLWHDTLAGIQTFFILNLTRGANPGLNISTQFFGQMYNLDYPLPWYNTLVWTAITVPPMVLLIGAVGIWASIKRWRSDPYAVLVVLQWATLVTVRMLPMAPPHDAERLFLPSFGFFALLVGIGAGRMLYRETLLQPDKIPAQGWAKVAIAMALTGAAAECYRYAPQWLSYYNWGVGGLRGAVALGMEPTYYWDGLNRTTLDWLNEHTGEGEKIAFAAAPPDNLYLLQKWGLLKHDIQTYDPGRFRWYVLQRRPSAWQAWDEWLIEHDQPAYQKKLLGVPLVEVYTYEQYEHAKAAAQQGDSAPGEPGG